VWQAVLCGSEDELAVFYQLVNFFNMPDKRLVSVNEKGRRIGEDHPRARFTDHDVELLLRLREEGVSYQRIAEIMECSYDYVRSVCLGRRRGQYASRFKRI
jgi:hypothetical protein